MPPSTSDQRGVPDARTVVGGFWALATALHLVNTGRGSLDLFAGLTLASALWALARPSAAGRLAAMAGFHVLETVHRWPIAPDHQVLAAMVNIVILVTYLRRRPAETRALIASVTPGACVVLLVGYAAAALAKYNSSFLDAAHSCATFLGQAASFGLVARNDPSALGFVALTIGSETSILALLLLRRTRRYGVVLGIAFHLMLCLSPTIAVGDFSVTLWALFLLFASNDDVERLGATVDRWRSRSAIARDIRRAPAMVVVGIASAIIIGASQLEIGRLLIYILGWLAIIATGFTTLGVLGLSLRQRTPPPLIRRPSAGHLAAGAAMALIASSPYLGLATSMRLTMFSNLRTEGPGTNHLFLPSYHVIDTQNEWLIVEEWLSDGTVKGSPGWPDASAYEAAYPVAQIRQFLGVRGRGGVFRTSEGSVIRVEPGEDHELRSPPSWWQRNTQHYRAFIVPGVSDPTMCSN